jgi:probable HAF family extracellular repeat protein
VVGYSDVQAGGIHGFLWNKGLMTDLGIPGIMMLPSAINPKGQVVGSSFDGVTSSGFIWENGVVTRLPPLTGRDSYVFAINPAGEVVGLSGAHATLWTRK